MSRMHLALLMAAGVAAGLFLGCGSHVDNGGTPPPAPGPYGAPGTGTWSGGTPSGSPAASGGGTTPGGGPGGCTKLCTQQMTCQPGKDTTVSGTVFAPTPAKFGPADPIYNAIVYVPNDKVLPFPSGVACDVCATPSGSPLTTALTGPDGKFTLKNVPAGDNIPLVIQVGRWRRQVRIPKVTGCGDTTLPAELTRLPRNKKEGDIPFTAIATGNADALECVLRKIGVDEAEFTHPTGNGRIHLYKSNGAFVKDEAPAAADLTGNLGTLNKYDMTLLECEGMPIDKGPADKQNLIKYTDAGGRLFVTHYEYTYLYDVPPFSQTAQWAVGQQYPTQMNAPLTGIIDQSFPKGKAFAEWLQIVGATAPMPGQIQIFAPRHDVEVATPPSQRWVYTEGPNTLQQFTFNTPVGAPEKNQCGRVLFSDFHVSDIANISVQFPTECNDKPMTAQERVLEFLLFDLASCVQSDTKPPMPPVIIK